ncbi:MAG TPA: type VI secretion system lipoprotein TssJ [Acidobacteriota bacterium]|nr:type VI secretion system lipoprotein TssJ [Acidobacteriota bacterium]
MSILFARPVVARTIVGLFLIAMIAAGTGCGWIFGKQKKPMKIEIIFIGSDSLNFDGNQFQAVQVKAFVLKRAERFWAADVRAFFDPGYDPGFMTEFGKDTLGSVTAIVAPEEMTRPLTIEIPFIRARDEKPIFAVIANFAQPPRGENRERLAFDLKKKTRQTVRVDLGTNWVARGSK